MKEEIVVREHTHKKYLQILRINSLSYHLLSMFQERLSQLYMILGEIVLYEELSSIQAILGIGSGSLGLNAKLLVCKDLLIFSEHSSKCGRLSFRHIIVLTTRNEILHRNKC